MKTSPPSPPAQSAPPSWDARLKEAMFALIVASGLTHAQVSLRAKPGQAGYVRRKLIGDRELRGVDVDLILGALNVGHVDLLEAMLVTRPKGEEGIATERINARLGGTSTQERIALQRHVDARLEEAKAANPDLTDDELDLLGRRIRADLKYPGILDALKEEGVTSFHLADRYGIHRSQISRLRTSLDL